VPLLRFDDLTIDGEPVLVTGEHSGQSGAAAKGDGGGTPSGKPSGTRRAAIGTDLTELDALGMRIAMAYELRRLRRAGHSDATNRPEDGARALVVDVHSPAAIRSAEAANAAVATVIGELETRGISRLYPGFDILTIADGKPDRLIELKSSGVDARVQVMSWNEWKTARASDMRDAFWLYLVGNLRADLPHATPYVRAIHDPFGTLVSDEITEQQLRRAVQLRVREFEQAEHLDLGVAPRPHGRHSAA
jgi:hypothetical protein